MSKRPKEIKQEKPGKRKDNKTAGAAKRRGKPKTERTEKSRQKQRKSRETKEDRKKSFSAFPLIMAAVIAVLAGTFGKFGFGGGGDGFGLLPGGFGNGTVETESEIEKSESTTQESSSAETESETGQTDGGIRYVEVTVNEDGYLYQNSKRELEVILDDIYEGDVIRLKIHRASKNDVDELIDAANERGVKVIYD